MTEASVAARAANAYSPPGQRPAYVDDSRRLLGIVGLVGAVTILAGIVAVSMIPEQLDPYAFDKTLTEILAHRSAEVWAGWLFAIGLATIVPFIWLLVRTFEFQTRTAASIGASLITVGVTVNIVGSFAMVAIGHMLAPNLADASIRGGATALLALGIGLDSMYNLALGVGLLFIAHGMRRSPGWPRWLGRLASVVGVLSLPASFEWYSVNAAAYQYASGTLFLLWIIAVSVIGIRRS